MNLNERRETLKSLKSEDKRYPRALGLTFALKDLQSLPPNQKQEKLQYIKNLIIQQWILNGQTINGQIMTIQDMATYLSLPMTTILTSMTKQLKSTSRSILGDNEKTSEFARVLFLGAFFSGSEITALAKKQAAILSAAQGDTYKPFISSEVNKSIANLISSHKIYTNLLEIMKPNQTQGLPGSGTPSDTHTVTPNEAINLIRKESQSVLEAPESLESVYQALRAEASDPIPDVGARNQDLTAIGVKVKGTNNGESKAHRAEVLGTNTAPSLPIIADADLDDFRA